jgi:hypothetical protein
MFWASTVIPPKSETTRAHRDTRARFFIDFLPSFDGLGSRGLSLSQKVTDRLVEAVRGIENKADPEKTPIVRWEKDDSTGGENPNSTFGWYLSKVIANKRR